MKLSKSLIALTSALAISAAPLFAGTKTFQETVIVEEEPSSWYNAELSSGYHSLNMFRGVNVLRNDSYGSGVWVTDANFTWNISGNDTLTLGGVQVFGSSKSNYREFDAYLDYVHSIGDLDVALGYTFYHPYPSGDQYYANELSAEVAYTIDLGFMSLTPAVTYFFNLGPDNDTGAANGIVNTGSSYLDIRVDGSIPVIADVVFIDPWIAFGINFDYNLKDDLQPFIGANNLEFGVEVPWIVNDIITISGYVAYSYAFEELNGLYASTQPNTFWGGGKVIFSF